MVPGLSYKLFVFRGSETMHGQVWDNVSPWRFRHRTRFNSVVCQLHLPTRNPRDRANMTAFLGAFALGAAFAVSLREGVMRFWGHPRKQENTDNVTQADGPSSLRSDGHTWLPARSVLPPHPNWKPGDAQACPLSGGTEFYLVNVDATPASDLYPLVISTAVPRPVAFISSVDESGIVNLAPYSFFNAMGEQHPMLSGSLLPRKGYYKDVY